MQAPSLWLQTTAHLRAQLLEENLQQEALLLA